MLLEISVSIRLRRREQPIIKPNLGIHRVGRAHPMDGAFDFTPSRRATSFALEIRGAAQFSDIAAGILHDLVAFDDVSVFKAHFATWAQAEIFRRRSLHEIIAIDEELSPKGNLAAAGVWILWIIDGVQFFDFAFGVICYDHFNRP